MSTTNKILKTGIISLFICLFPVNILAQSRHITGNVSDNTGEAIIGANISIKGTSIGTIINQTRRRGFGYQSTAVGSPCDIAVVDKEQLLLAVEKERRNELAFEGHRWFDLIRTDRALTVMRATGKKLNETNFICPIPQGQIDINPKLTQNSYRIEPK